MCALGNLGRALRTSHTGVHFKEMPYDSLRTEHSVSGRRHSDGRLVAEVRLWLPGSEVTCQEARHLLACRDSRVSLRLCTGSGGKRTAVPVEYSCYPQT